MEAALANMPWAEMKSILSDIEVLLEANEEADVLRNIKQLRADLQTLLTGRENDARRLITGAGRGGGGSSVVGAKRARVRSPRSLPSAHSPYARDWRARASPLAEFTARVHRAEAAANEALPSLDDMRARLALLDRRKAALSEELARLRHARELSAQQLASLTQHMTALKQATANLTASHTAQVPRVKCVRGARGARPPHPACTRCPAGPSARHARGGTRAAAPLYPRHQPAFLALPRPVPRRHSLSLYANVSSIRWDYESEDVAGCEWAGRGAEAWSRARTRARAPHGSGRPSTVRAASPPLPPPHSRVERAPPARPSASAPVCMQTWRRRAAHLCAPSACSAAPTPSRRPTGCGATSGRPRACEGGGSIFQGAFSLNVHPATSPSRSEFI